MKRLLAGGPVPLVVSLLLIASASAAQFGGGRRRQIDRYVPEGSYTGSFLFCRISFRNNPYGDGAGWDVDYERADLNLSFRLSELTKTPISHDPSGRIRHILIRLTDPELYKCPFIMMTEPGGSYFDPEEAAALRDYLLRGGFLWADDFWGTRAWINWAGSAAHDGTRTPWQRVFDFGEGTTGIEGEQASGGDALSYLFLTPQTARRTAVHQ